jgi:adenylate cyclase
MARRLLPVVLVAFLAITVVVLHALTFLTGAGQRVELKQTDLWFRLRGAIPTPEDVVILSIDENTYRELSLSTLAPLPRGLVAELLEKLAHAGASLAIVDLFFRDPGNDLDANKRLASALGMMPTFIGAFQFDEVSQDRSASRVIEVSPIEQFAKQAEQVVLMNIRGVDIVRFFRLPRHRRDKNLALAAAYAARPPVKEAPGELDLIRFYGPAGSMPRVSAYQVLRGDDSFNAAQFSGKTVLIGNALEAKTGFAAKDSFLTPAGPVVMSGVEIHATVVGNIMERSWIRRMDVVGELVGISLVLSGVIVTLAIVSPFHGALVTAFVVTLWGCVAYAGFLSGVLIPGVLASAVFLPIAAVVVTLAKHQALKVRVAQVEDMLGLSD